ncbi:hypothetical protein OBBRIDRAFT_819127 [Obba rivulosa]|uniref:F-box domain-containing protein n=1 Tax=Obba rivulosa TaxID=1052685 RepID=A0A8E2AX40_9APHY|nr:hypothetical protein OBBRIDRAFT_819127 [Obba rivulosa]
MPAVPSKLWSIHELLELIFSQLNGRSLARVACVCRLWSDIALDFLWHDVDDLYKLLGLLASFKRPEPANMLRGNNRYYSFRNSLQPSDWLRFQRYSRRVRRLTHDQLSGKSRGKLLSSNALEEIVRTCPYPEIIPNLQSFSWYSGGLDRQEKSLVFIHSKIKHLSLQLHASPELASYIHQVATRASRLEHLEFRLSEAMQDTERDLIPLLPSFQALQRITLPIYGLTSGIFVALSRMRHLKTIALSAPTESGNGDRSDVMTFSPTLAPTSFPALRRISFSAQIAHATRLLSGAFAPSSLAYIYLHCLVVSDADEVQRLFEVVSQRCDGLVELSVDFIIGPGSPLRVPAPAMEARPDLRTFYPLFSAKRLARFEFRWDYPLSLTDEDMRMFALEWPALETLVLNPEPVLEHARPTLTLASLAVFASHCPRLRKLGLYLDATAAPSPRDFARPIVPFAQLETLLVGVSPIKETEPVALFLSQLCPLGCALSSGLRWPDAFGIALDHAGILDDRRLRLTEHWVRWNDVAKVLPLATKARQQERTRMETLQRDLEAMTLSWDRERQRSEELEQEVHGWRNRVGSRR